MKKGLKQILVSMIVLTAATSSIAAANATNAVVTHFSPGLELSAPELKQVLAVAKQCGLTNSAEVSTFHFIPAGGKGVSVQSRNRVKDRDTYSDTLSVYRVGWTTFNPDSMAIKEGPFSPNPLSMYTTHQRQYQLGGTNAYVVIGNGVDVAFADEVMAAFAAGRLKHDGILSAEEEMEPPQGIFRLGERYELRKNFSKGYSFKMEKGFIVLTGIVTRMI